MREQLTNDRIWAPIPLEGAAAASCDESSDVKLRYRDDERR